MRRKLDLLWLLTSKAVTLKYKRTVLGVLWSLLNPILMTLVLWLVFRGIMRFGMKNYPFFLLSALFAWNWFTSSLSISSAALIRSADLVRKVKFPKPFLVYSTIGAQFITFLFGVPVLVILSCSYANGPSAVWLIAIPLLAISQLLFTIGVCLMVSVLNAFFRDMEYLVGVGTRMLFWLTPIIYPIDKVPSGFRSYFYLNPLSHVITAWRDLFMNNMFEWRSCLGMMAVGAVVCVAGLLAFRALSGRVDEVI